MHKLWSDVVAKVLASSRFTTALLLLYYCFTTDCTSCDPT
jgi:hypothetical protein